jgi:hypothetical protein
VIAASHKFSAPTHEPFAICTKIIKRMLAAIDKKSVGPNISGQILKLGGEAMFPYLARPLSIAINNATIPSD